MFLDQTWALLPGAFFSAPLSLLLPVDSIAVLGFSSLFALLARPALPITPLTDSQEAARSY